MNKEYADRLKPLIDKLPRIGTNPIQDIDQLRALVYDVAIDLAAQRKVRHNANDHTWTLMSDLLDDVLDIADFIDRLK